MSRSLRKYISDSAASLRLPSPRSLYLLAGLLPKRYSVALVVLAAAYFPLATLLAAWPLEYVTSALVTPPSRGEPAPSYLFHLTTSTAVSFTLLVLALLLSLVIFLAVIGIAQAVLWPAPSLGRLRIHAPPPLEKLRRPGPATGPLAGYEKIGIILAGGGAKGAYQAGALKAIYEFVVEHNAHHKVKMIAGSSIGAWNALFWLADLIQSPDGGPGLLEQWWSQISLQGVVRPTLYVPLYRNYFLSSAPWEDIFTRIFGDKDHPAARERLLRHVSDPAEGMHFYFTLSNVSEARLDYATNRKEHDKESKGRVYEVTDLTSLRDAIFCSMGIPPIFKYRELKDETNKTALFEDGGVVNNLPIRLGTELEGCDLLFVLPLNATFVQQKVNRRSLSRRMLRVMDVRQGVLERNALKMVRLYNQLAGLRDVVKKLQSERDEGDAPQDDEALPLVVRQALKRKNRHVRVFCICPKPDPQLLINTMEFWKSDGASEAFRLMYEATKKQLKENFRKLVNTDGGVKMVQVGAPENAVAVVENF